MAAKARPNTVDSDSSIMLLTVPIRFSASKKRYSEAPNPAAPSSMMDRISPAASDLTVVITGTPIDAAIANRAAPPMADFRYTALAMLILWATILLILLSTAQNSADDRISRSP